MVILLNAAFTVAVLFIFYKVSMEPTALIGAWFGFTTVELWALAGIKKREILPVVAYILGEAYVDAQGVKTKKE
jgi:hypothetical protein